MTLRQLAVNRMVERAHLCAVVGSVHCSYSVCVEGDVVRETVQRTMPCSGGTTPPPEPLSCVSLCVWSDVRPIPELQSLEEEKAVAVTYVQRVIPL